MRWRGKHTRWRVESCLSISTKRPRRGAAMPVEASGVWHWQRYNVIVRYTLRRTQSTVEESSRTALLGLRFNRDGIDIAQQIRLTTTKPNYGGERWWFTCPRCLRRTPQLHLANNSYRFACRVCQDLSYESAQTSRGRSQSFFRLVAAENGCSMRAARRIFRERYGGVVHEAKLIEARSGV